MSKNFKFFELLYTDQKKYFVLILAMVILASLFETLGIASIIPLLSFMVSGKEFILEIPFLNNSPDLQNILQDYSNTDIILFLLISIILIFFIKNLYLILFNFIKETFLFNLRKKFSQKLFNKFLDLNYEKYNKKNSSIYINTILNVVSDATNNVISSSIFLFTEIFLVLFIFILLLAIEPISAIIVIGTFSSITLFIYFKIKFKLKQLSIHKIKHDQMQIQNLYEGFSMIKYLKTIKNINYFKNKFNNNNDQVNDISKKQILLELFPKYILEFISVLMLSLLISFLLFYLNYGIEKIVPIVALYALSAIRLTPSINKILSSLQKLKYGFAPMDKLHSELIKYKIKKLNLKHYIIKKNLVLKNISFKHERDNILKNIDIKINLGDKIAIIGETGSGKTTLIDIISGILKPKTGTIFYDNKNSKKFKDKMLKFGYIPQSPTLIGGSLKTNVTFDLDKFDKNHYKKILYCSCLENFNKTLKNRLLNNLGESGSKISGGQKQRISIARALYCNPQILIFDEGTNALDKKTEEKLIKRIYKNFPKIIIIFISHDINPQICNKIFKISNQRLIKVK